jgi:diguanylate cyclase (GGDEF)-like protein
MNESMLRRIKECPNLPSLPTIAMQVLELAKNSETDLAEIARIISKDPALSGKILRTVNSSFYGRSQNVATISSAMVIMGLQSVKTLVLGFSLVNNLTKTKSKGLKHMAYWKHSIYAATAVRVLANKVALVQQEEAFLIALLMDMGMLVLDAVIGEEYGEALTLATSHEDLIGAEQASLGVTHAEVMGWLAEQWKLPPVLCVPMQSHHDPSSISDPALRKLADVVWVGGRCADVFVDDAPAMAIAQVRQRCLNLWGLPETGTDALLEEIGNRTKEVASLFDINIGTTIQFEAVLKRANETLVEITLQSQMRATQLAEQNVELKRAATIDALTGLCNRGNFDAVVAERFNAAVSAGTPLSLLLLDVDKFKSINDQHGHPAGDQVLRELGKLLRSTARMQDTAARYGGEEMCLVLPGMTRAVAASFAEKLRRLIAGRPLMVDGKTPLRVTVSIGVACYERGCVFNHVSHLLKAADLGVYAAKRSGRNCVRVLTLPARQPPTKAA